MKRCLALQGSQEDVIKTQGGTTWHQHVGNWRPPAWLWLNLHNACGYRSSHNCTEEHLYLEAATPQLAGPSGTHPGRFSPVGAGAKVAVTALFLTAKSWPRNE